TCRGLSGVTVTEEGSRLALLAPPGLQRPHHRLPHHLRRSAVTWCGRAAGGDSRGDQQQVRLDTAASHHLHADSCGGRTALAAALPPPALRVSTQEEPPAAPSGCYATGVTMLQVLAVSSTALQVSWEPPPQNLTNGDVPGYYLGFMPGEFPTHLGFKDARNGVITNYRLAYSHASSHGRSGNVVSEGLRATVAGLTPWTNYTVTVAASTRAGKCQKRRRGEGTVSGPRAAVVSWAPPARPHGRISRYTVHWEPAVGVAPPTAAVEPHLTHLTLHDPVHTTHQVWVTASTRMGEGPASSVAVVKPHTHRFRVQPDGTLTWQTYREATAATTPVPPPTTTAVTPASVSTFLHVTETTASLHQGPVECGGHGRRRPPGATLTTAGGEWVRAEVDGDQRSYTVTSLSAAPAPLLPHGSQPHRQQHGLPTEAPHQGPATRGAATVPVRHQQQPAGDAVPGAEARVRAWAEAWGQRALHLRGVASASVGPGRCLPPYAAADCDHCVSDPPADPHRRRVVTRRRRRRRPHRRGGRVHHRQEARAHASPPTR
ncbi:Down syndrome cell adhesion molecule-like protein 2-like 15, partial [Homarus americanus]